LFGRCNEKHFYQSAIADDWQ